MMETESSWSEYIHADTGEDLTPLFELGEIKYTPGLQAELAKAKQTLNELLHRHVIGDWVDQSSEDLMANMHNLVSGGAIFSNYFIKTGARVYIVTEADRHETACTLSHEYPAF